MERTYREDAVSLTHEQLATLLGVGRSYISRVMQTFKAGRRTGDPPRFYPAAQSREALGKRACQCNEAVKNHVERSVGRGLPDRRGPERLKGGWLARRIG